MNAQQWANLVELGKEAINLLDDDQQQYAKWQLERGDCWYRSAGLDDAMIELYVGDMRLVVVDKLILARSNATPQNN